MKDSEEQNDQPEEESLDASDQREIEDASSFPVPKARMQTILQGFEMFALEKGRPSVDLGSLSEAQRDKLIEAILQHENNAFNYHTERLKASERLEEKKLHASTIDKRTIRYTVIISLLSFVTLTLLILFFKENFLNTWFAFVFGLIGGAGGMKFFERPSSSEKIESFIGKEAE